MTNTPSTPLRKFLKALSLELEKEHIILIKRDSGINPRDLRDMDLEGLKGVFLFVDDLEGVKDAPEMQDYIVEREQEAVRSALEELLKQSFYYAPGGGMVPIRAVADHTIKDFIDTLSTPTTKEDNEPN